MQSEDSEPARPAEAPAPMSEKKPMSRRKRRRLLFAALVVVVGIVIIFWGWDETGNREFVEVHQIVADQAKVVANTSQYLDGEIEVQGIVDSWSGGSTFRLADRQSVTEFVAISMTGILPQGFENGKSVTVKGDLKSSLPLTIVATGVTVGCSSRY